MAELKLDLLEDLEEIQCYSNNLERVVKIGMRMDPHIKSKLIHFLKKNQHTFAWTIDDIVGINIEVITHRLEVNLDYPLIR